MSDIGPGRIRRISLSTLSGPYRAELGRRVPDQKLEARLGTHIWTHIWVPRRAIYGSIGDTYHKSLPFGAAHPNQCPGQLPGRNKQNAVDDTRASCRSNCEACLNKQIATDEIPSQLQK